MLQLLPDAVDLTEYLPASQATQSSQVLFESVLGLLNPALQEQFIFMVDPAAESAWTPQGRQLSRPLLPIVVEKTVRLSGLWREFQCIFSTQFEIGLFPAGERSL